MQHAAVYYTLDPEVLDKLSCRATRVVTTQVVYCLLDLSGVLTRSAITTCTPLSYTPLAILVVTACIKQFAVMLVDLITVGAFPGKLPPSAS